MESVIKALENYLSVKNRVDEPGSHFTDGVLELKRARAALEEALAAYIDALTTEVETLQQALSKSVYKLNRLKTENARLQSRGEWRGGELQKLLRTLAELEGR